MFNQTKRFHNLYTSGLLLVMLTVGGLLLPSMSTNALADTPAVSGSVTAGALSETATGPYTFSGTPGGTPTYPISFSGSDLTGAAAGWNLTITSTTLTSGSNTIPVTASTVTGTTANCTSAGTCSNPTLTNLVTTAVAIPAAVTAPTAVKFFSTAAATGSGTYTVVPTVSVFMPGSTKLGTYTSTITLTIVSGP